jgi:5-methylcytosine-specific restriction endonuclease McrA
MTDHRRPPIPYSDAERGVCRWCGKEILYEKGVHEGKLDRRRRWHPECVEAYEASDPREARRRIRKRDRGRCADCGLDTYALRRSLRGKGMTRALRKRGFVPRRSLWELDHIVPLVDGGSHDPSNLQTLCTPCHKKKTAQEARQRAVERSEASEEVAVMKTEEAERPSPRRKKAAPESLDLILEKADQTNARVSGFLSEWDTADRANSEPDRMRRAQGEVIR